MVFQHTQLAVKAAIPPFNTLSTQLDGKHIKQLLRRRIGCKGSHHTQTLDSCFQVRTAKGINSHTINSADYFSSFFIVRKHLAFEELTPTLLREMIEKIVVHECSYDENGTRRQDIEIYYSFVGKIDLPE